jgi:hypothetical protein
MINLREFRRKWSWPNWGTILAASGWSERNHQVKKPQSEQPATWDCNQASSELYYHYTNPSSWDCLLVLPICKGMISGDSVLGLWTFWHIFLKIVTLQELHTMCTRSLVRTFVSKFITQLEALFDKIPSYSTSKEMEKTKWSDIVAGRHLSVPEYIPITAQGTSAGKFLLDKMT